MICDMIRFGIILHCAYLSFPVVPYFRLSKGDPIMENNLFWIVVVVHDIGFHVVV